MGLSGVSVTQLLVIGLIFCLLFGTKRLKGLGQELGQAVQEFRRAMDDQNKPES